MVENSAISWTDHTFNPWIGCSKVSPACDGCYAEALMGSGGRFARVEWGGPGKGVGTRNLTSPSTWRQPLKWNRKAASAPGETFVFCASLADVFDNVVPSEWRRDLFDLIHATPNLTWLLLTKRPSNIVKLFDQAYRPEGEEQSPNERAGNWPRNAAIGCTVVNQAEADRDLPPLLIAKTILRPAFAFVSMEPLLGETDIRWAISRNRFERASGFLRRAHFSPGFELDSRLDWVIAGGETDQGDHKARPADPDWFRSLRNQCFAADVPFHFKQWGEWQPNVGQTPSGSSAQAFIFDRGRGAETVWKLGKDKDPCTLDRVAHDARPEVAR